MANRQLALGTISFAICFAAWGLLSAFAPRFREIHSLSASQTALLVATPVLLGSLARIPMGLLTDRWKGRAVFSGLLLVSAIPPFLAPVVSSYSMLLVVGFFLGVAGSSFAVGVGFVSPWFGSEKQGTALGVFGLGDARRLSRRPLRCRSTRRCHFRRPISRLRRTLPVCQSSREDAELSKSLVK